MVDVELAGFSRGSRSWLAGPPSVGLAVYGPSGRDHLGVGGVGHTEEADVVVLSIVRPACQRFVHVLKPVTTHQGRVVQDAGDVVCVDCRAFLLVAAETNPG